MLDPNSRYSVGDFNGDGFDDIFVVSGQSSFRRRRLYLGRANGTGFDTACYGEQDGACGTDAEDYMLDPNSRYSIGDFNGDGFDDIFVVSGQSSFRRRRLYLGRANGTGFNTGCFGQEDGACGTDAEDYMLDPNSRYSIGDFNGDGFDDIFMVSGQSSFRRRRLYLGRANGTDFDTACYGEQDGTCGTDAEDYMLDPNSRYSIGDFNGDGFDDIFVSSGQTSFRRRRLYLSHGD